MIIKNKLFVMPLLLLSIIISCQPTVDLDAEKEGLLQTDRDFVKASLEHGAAEAFKMYMADDAMMMPAGGAPVYGNQAIYEGMLGDGSEYTLDWEPQDGEVSGSADMGWTWGKYVYSWTDDNGEIKKAYGKYVNVWKKQADGSWKVKIDIGNSGPTPQAEDEKANSEE